ncbi:MAG: hypothetical protein Q9168_002716 [Polycauliona sp. 1 TL-2023]
MTYTCPKDHNPQTPTAGKVNRTVKALHQNPRFLFTQQMPPQTATSYQDWKQFQQLRLDTEDRVRLLQGKLEEGESLEFAEEIRGLLRKLHTLAAEMSQAQATKIPEHQSDNELS